MLQKPVVAITGGSRGLGFELAQVLLQAGFAVSICARDKNALAGAKELLSQLGPVLAHKADVTNPHETLAFLSATALEFGRIDALVHNASTLGTIPMPALAETTAQNLMQAYETNAVAPIIVTAQALPLLKQQTAGLIVMLSSDAANGGYPGWGAYGASKAAVNLIARTFASELAETNLHVFAVDPGDMDTDMHRQAAPNDANLPHPALSAKAMLPLFLPLRRPMPTLVKPMPTSTMDFSTADESRGPLSASSLPSAEHPKWPAPSGTRFTVLHLDGESILTPEKRGGLG